MPNLKFKFTFIILTLATLVISTRSYAQTTIAGNEIIRLNQLGFYPGANKIAVVTANTKGNFFIKDVNDHTVYTAPLLPAAQPAFSGKATAIANFSGFSKSGTYRLYVPDAGYSYPFSVKAAVHKNVAGAVIKAYYFQRASIPLLEKFAGKWHRAEGHPDTTILIHSSAVSDKRPEGTVIASPRGWYDAGDYNKYIVNSGISTSTLLSLYEDFPAYMKTVRLNIPESTNQLPDVLDEVLWNLRWMLTMQDQNDGGVYHKLTNARFDGMVMPGKATQTRYVVQKSTAAALDFAAVAAQASRIFRKYPKQLPGLADSCIKASEYAYNWAVKNPAVIYNQNEMNKSFKPAVLTGDYGDRRLDDEFIWASAELYATTGKPEYLTRIKAAKASMGVPGWGSVGMLGYYTLLKSPNINTELPELKAGFLAYAGNMIADVDSDAYATVMNKTKSGFNWGSNSNAANQGMLLVKAYQLSGDKKYLVAALGNLDYLLGRNGTGYSYITGYGSKTPMHPHHRPSVADGVTEPIPGLMAGGPNPGMQDGIKVPSNYADEAYIDDDRAYAVNEIAINWNAPIAYLANAIEALQKQLLK